MLSEGSEVVYTLVMHSGRLQGTITGQVSACNIKETGYLSETCYIVRGEFLAWFVTRFRYSFARFLPLNSDRPFDPAICTQLALGAQRTLLAQWTCPRAAAGLEEHLSEALGRQESESSSSMASVAAEN